MFAEYSSGQKYLELELTGEKNIFHEYQNHDHFLDHNRV